MPGVPQISVNSVTMMTDRYGPAGRRAGRFGVKISLTEVMAEKLRTRSGCNVPWMGKFGIDSQVRDFDGESLRVGKSSPLFLQHRSSGDAAR